MTTMQRATVAAVFALSLFAVPLLSHAGRIDAGTVEAGFSLLLDFESSQGTTLQGDLLGGYFIMDGVLVGGRLGFHNDDYLTLVSGFAILEQHFETDTPWLPYLGASLGLMHAAVDLGEETNSTTALAAGGAAGIKFYITETACLDFSLNVVLASDEIFPADDKAENVDMTLKAGLRFFLF